MAGVDYYAVLNVTRDATPKDIREAYRKLAMKWHPDKNTDHDKKECERNFIQISEAYSILTDATLKHVFDPPPQPKSADDPLAKFSFFAPAQTPNHFVSSTFRATPRSPKVNLVDEVNSMHEDLRKKSASIFGVFFAHDIFNKEFAVRGSCPISKKRKKVYPINLRVGLDQIYRGETLVIDDIYEKIALGGSRILIPKGKKVILKLGSHWRDGECVVVEDDDIGIMEIRIVETAHHCFVRDGNNLRCRVQMSLLDALTATSYKIDVFGAVYEIDKDEVFGHDTIKTLVGYGMKLSESSELRGNILVSFDIIYPTMINEHQTNLLKEAFSL